jgi:hypothetical protein
MLYLCTVNTYCSGHTHQISVNEDYELVLHNHNVIAEFTYLSSVDWDTIHPDTVCRCMKIYFLYLMGNYYHYYNLIDNETGKSTGYYDSVSNRLQNLCYDFGKATLPVKLREFANKKINKDRNTFYKNHNAIV